jgi:ATP-dependent Clp protease ATP-binding subunit ClpC
VNFKNTIVIMTSNIGSEEFNMEAQKIWFTTNEAEEDKIIANYDEITQKVMKQLPEFFAPEFLNRIDKTLVFNPLDKRVLKSIVLLQLGELSDRLKKIWLDSTFDQKVPLHIVSETYNPEYWARPVRRYIQDQIEDVIADALVEKRAKKSVLVTLVKKKLSFEFK